MRTFLDAKQMAKVLRQAFADRQVDISHSETLEIVAGQFGSPDWNVLSAQIAAADGAPRAKPAAAVSIEPAIPIFRIFSVDKAMEFYRDFLGFTVDWEHRFGDNFPLYCQVSRSAITLHLSEHAGDASPGARIFVPVGGIVALHRELAAKDYRYMKPGITDQPWGREVTVIDPFSNRITFCEPGEAA